MSKHNRPIEQRTFDSEDDSAIRELFREVGHESAPPHLATNIISRLEAHREEAFTPIRPLIPSVVWVAVGLSVISAIVYAFSMPLQPGNQLMLNWISQWSLPDFQVSLPTSFPVVEHIPSSFVLIIPLIFLQFYLIKNYYDGRYSQRE